MRTFNYETISEIGHVESSWRDLPCCVRIVQKEGGITVMQQVVGPMLHHEADEWLQKIGFKQHRPGLWLQPKGLQTNMQYCCSRVELKGAEAWIELLHTPEEVDIRPSS